jgi:hypothetical protein
MRAAETDIKRDAVVGQRKRKCFFYVWFIPLNWLAIAGLSLIYRGGENLALGVALFPALLIHLLVHQIFGVLNSLGNNLTVPIVIGAVVMLGAGFLLDWTRVSSKIFFLSSPLALYSAIASSHFHSSAKQAGLDQWRRLRTNSISTIPSGASPGKSSAPPWGSTSAFQSRCLAKNSRRFIERARKGGRMPPSPNYVRRAEIDRVHNARLLTPAPIRASYYFIECSPIIFPSVSCTSEMKPYSPIENFSLKIFPPFCAARLASTEQSRQLK